MTIAKEGITKTLNSLLLIALLLFPLKSKAAILLINQSNIKIPAGTSVYWTITLSKEDNLLMIYSANGGVNLYIKDAFGNTWQLSKDISYARAKFVVPHNGLYQIYIDNSHSIISDKYVNFTSYLISSKEIKQFLYELAQRLQNYLGMVSNYNPNIPIPTITYKNCNQPNAFYSPSFNSITICNELIWNIMDFEMLESTDNWEEETINAVSFILFHELGHALIHLCDLPVLGKEEDAADALATLAAIELNPEMAYEGAILFLNILNHGTPIFWDSHSPDEERFYNILCWLYGSDPKTFFLIRRKYPELQNRNCQYEYYQLDKSWTKLLENCGFKF